MKEQVSNSSAFRGFSGNQLKMFAILAMTIDHLAWTLWPGYDHREWWLLAIHFFGRLAEDLINFAALCTGILVRLVLFPGFMYLTYSQKPWKSEETGSWHDGIYHHVRGCLVSGYRCVVRSDSVWYYHSLAVYAFL